jgi:hypothetical protein
MLTQPPHCRMTRRTPQSLRLFHLERVYAHGLGPWRHYNILALVGNGFHLPFLQGNIVPILGRWTRKIPVKLTLDQNLDECLL